ncbi:hypothetical protein ACFYN9_01675 [Streptomyces collinus]|uniref:hypothetical protein n=1 Tax=Streptomyces collinus TaxID=42684 RepID=UPI0036A693E2
MFGACENNAQNRGVGVQGNGPEAGLSGFSIKGVGVRAHSDHGDAVHAFAHDSAHNGILGHNNATGRAPKSDSPVGNGVFGFTEVPNANGVCGAVALNNTEGAGVCGIGPMAGRFVGNVAVTGTLNVQNVNVLQRISELEQKVNVAPQLQAQVQRLSDQVRSLQDQVNSLAANLTERVTRSEFEIAGLKQFSHSHA